MSPKTLSVFEHQKLCVGEETADGRNSGGLRERDFNALVRFNDATGGRYFDVGYRRITFRQYVGYIQVGNLGIAVLPKVDRLATERGDEARWHDGLLRMLEIAVGLRLETSSAAAQSTVRASLLDLVAIKLLEETERLAHQGLSKGYRDEEKNGTTFRGRLLVTQNLRENHARADRFYVRYQSYDHDIVVNRILGAALSALRGLKVSPSVSARAAACHANFPDVSPVRVVPDLFDRIVFGRSTARYREVLALARMILERYAPQLRSGSVPVFGLLFDMNALWERYVAALFRKVKMKVPGVVVTTQESVSFWKELGEPSRTIRPDIVVRAASTGQPLLVADTKWKVLRDGTPSNEDLKQMFAYNELFQSPRALLVYPGTGHTPVERHGEFVGRSHRCGTLHLGLFDAKGWSTAQMLDEVRQSLAELLT